MNTRSESRNRLSLFFRSFEFKTVVNTRKWHVRWRKLSKFVYLQQLCILRYLIRKRFGFRVEKFNTMSDVLAASLHRLYSKKITKIVLLAFFFSVRQYVENKEFFDKTIIVLMENDNWNFKHYRPLKCSSWEIVFNKWRVPWGCS